MVEAWYSSARGCVSCSARSTLKLQYIACSTDTYDAEAFTICNMVETHTAPSCGNIVARRSDWKIAEKSAKTRCACKLRLHEPLNRLIFVVSLRSYVAELLQGKIHELAGRELQMLLRSHDHEENIAILIRLQIVPERFVRRVADRFALQQTPRFCGTTDFALRTVHS